MQQPNPSAQTPPALFENIVQQLAEAIIFADREGVIRVWNRGAEALFGFAAAEAIGCSLDIIIPERFRPAHWAGYRQAIERGQVQHGGQVRTTRAVHQDGRKLYVDMSFGVVTGGDGAVMGSVAMARDATARHATETALRARVAALEPTLRAAGPGAGGEAAADGGRSTP